VNTNTKRRSDLTPKQRELTDKSMEIAGVFLRISRRIEEGRFDGADDMALDWCLSIMHGIPESGERIEDKLRERSGGAAAFLDTMEQTKQWAKSNCGP
jgi:hypothetical protein